MSPDAIAEAKAILKDATPKAIEKLIGLLASKDERIVFSAARKILDRQLGKPGVLMENLDGAQGIVISWANERAGQGGSVTDAGPVAKFIDSYAVTDNKRQ